MYKSKPINLFAPKRDKAFPCYSDPTRKLIFIYAMTEDMARSLGYRWEDREEQLLGGTEECKQ